MEQEHKEFQKILGFFPNVLVTIIHEYTYCEIELKNDTEKMICEINNFIGHIGDDVYFKSLLNVMKCSLLTNKTSDINYQLLKLDNIFKIISNDDFIYVFTNKENIIIHVLDHGFNYRLYHNLDIKDYDMVDMHNNNICFANCESNNLIIYDMNTALMKKHTINYPFLLEIIQIFLLDDNVYILTYNSLNCYNINEKKFTNIVTNSHFVLFFVIEHYIYINNYSNHISCYNIKTKKYTERILCYKCSFLPQYVVIIDDTVFAITRLRLLAKLKINYKIPKKLKFALSY